MNTSLMLRGVIATTLVAFLLTTVPSVGRAGIITTASVLDSAAASDRGANLTRIQVQLARADVEKNLTRFGVTPAQAMERVRALSDAEVASLATRMDQAPAGADAGLFELLGVVFIVLLVLDYTGVLHIFSHHR